MFERIVAALNAKVHIEVVVANLLNIYNSDMANDYFKFNLGGRVKTPNINNKKLVVRSCVDVQRVFVFLQKRAL